VDSKEWQPLLTQNKWTKTESVLTGKSSPKHLPKVTRGFGIAHSLESTKTESAPTRKSSPKHLSKVTRGFGSADSPCWLRKSQHERRRCWLGNHHQNTFQSWRVDLKALTAPVDSEKVNETTSKSGMWIHLRQHPCDSEIVNEN
jgi:hypothetical protein